MTQLYKVVAIDNFDREYVSDRLVAENLELKEAQTKANEMRSHSHDWFHVVRKQEDKLYTYDPR